jgi:hypothetical protein
MASRRRRRLEQLEAMLAGGQARLERARSRSLVVDTMVGVVRRERPVAVGILAASLASGCSPWSSRSATWPWPGSTSPAKRRPTPAAARAGTASASWSSPRWPRPPAARTGPRWLARSWPCRGRRACPGRPWCRGRACSRPGSRGTRWPSASTSPRGRPRASTVYGSLGVALVLLVSLFLFARLAVAAAELNATLEELLGRIAGRFVRHDSAAMIWVWSSHGSDPRFRWLCARCSGPVDPSGGHAVGGAAAARV